MVDRDAPIRIQSTARGGPKIAHTQIAIIPHVDNVFRGAEPQGVRREVHIGGALFAPPRKSQSLTKIVNPAVGHADTANHAVGRVGKERTDNGLHLCDLEIADVEARPAEPPAVVPTLAGTELKYEPFSAHKLIPLWPVQPRNHFKNLTPTRVSLPYHRRHPLSRYFLRWKTASRPAGARLHRLPQDSNKNVDRLLSGLSADTPTKISSLLMAKPVG